MYAIVTDITPARATIAILSDSRSDLELTSDELRDAGLDDTAKIIVVDDEARVGDRIWL